MKYIKKYVDKIIFLLENLFANNNHDSYIKVCFTKILKIILMKKSNNVQKELCTMT